MKVIRTKHKMEEGISYPLKPIKTFNRLKLCPICEVNTFDPNKRGFQCCYTCWTERLG